MLLVPSWYPANELHKAGRTARRLFDDLVDREHD
jgi:hypothetical protein